MSNTDTSDLRGRVAERAAASTAVERAGDGPPPVAQVVRQAIERQSDSFRAVMPKGVDADRFGRLVLTAVKATPQLMECFSTQQGQVSVLLAAMQAAAVGLEPNTPTQQCWLLPRKNKGVVECQLSIGYRGWLKLVRRSGTIKSIFAEVVHAKDVFTWSRGLEEDQLEHVPFDGEGDAGELTHVYAVARFKDGGYQFVVLNRRQVEQRRAQSDSFRFGKDYSPWTKWPEEMWRKTAIRALVPYLDLSTDEADIAVKDESALRLGDEGVIEVDGEKEPAPALPAAPPPEPDDEELPAAARADAPVEDDPADRVKVRKALMAQCSKAFPLEDLAPKDRGPRRDVLRHAVSFCELGEHVSAADQSIAQMRRVESRLMAVEQGDITVAIDDTAKTVSVTPKGQAPIVVAFDQIGAE